MLRTMVSHFEQVRLKSVVRLRSDFRVAVLIKTAYTMNQENKLKNPSIQVNKDEYNKDNKFSPKINSPALDLTNIQDGNIGLHLQVPRGGTHPNGVGSELTILFFCSDLFFVTVGFV